MSVGHYYKHSAEEKIINYFRHQANPDVVADVFEITVWDNGGRFVVAFDDYTEFTYEAEGVDPEAGSINILTLIDD